MPPGLEITLLGPVTIHADAADDSAARPPEYVGNPQVEVALALLCLERHHGVTRDALADAIWPHGLPPTWASALRTVASRARTHLTRALGHDVDDLLVARGGTYLLHLPDGTTVDVERTGDQILAARHALGAGAPGDAQRLATGAVDRLRAPFLPDHDGEWVARQRARLATLFLVGLEVASQAAVALGDDATALTTALEATHYAPLRESAHRCLMAAHAAAGNRAEALRAYQRLRRLLADELGVDPDERTEAAYLGLLGSAPARSPGGGRRASPRDTCGQAPFVGRDTELAALAEAWSRASGTAPQFVLVSGEPGIGKTRLAIEFARRVTSEGGLVLFGECDEDETPPYQPFVEAFDGLLAATPDEDLPALTVPARAQLAEVFPAFARRRQTSTAPNRSVLFDAVTKLVIHAAVDRPLVVVVDNLQWADHDSLRLLRHLLRHIHGTPLLVLALARRDPPTGGALSVTLRALEQRGLAQRVRLGGLDYRACLALLHDMLPATHPLHGMAPRLVADTAGNPFMLCELIRAHVPGTAPTSGSDIPIPPGLHELVADRLATLGSPARQLLEAAAVCGSHFDLDVAGAAAGLDEAESWQAIEGGMASGLVVEIGADERRTGYRFAQNILQRAIYGQLGRPRRRHLHGRVADTMEELGLARLQSGDTEGAAMLFDSATLARRSWP